MAGYVCAKEHLRLLDTRRFVYETVGEVEYSVGVEDVYKRQFIHRLWHILENNGCSTTFMNNDATVTLWAVLGVDKVVLDGTAYPGWVANVSLEVKAPAMVGSNNGVFTGCCLDIGKLLLCGNGWGCGVKRDTNGAAVPFMRVDSNMKAKLRRDYTAMLVNFINSGNEQQLRRFFVK